MKFLQSSTMAVILAGAFLTAGQAQQQTPSVPDKQASQAATASGGIVASKEASDVASSSAEAAVVVKQRAQAFYSATISGNRQAASKFVDPASMSNFDQTDLRALSSATVDAVSVAEDGQSAVTNVTRFFVTPIRMSMPWKDTWKRIDGEWYISLPSPSGETPWGKMTSKNPDQVIDEKAMQQAMERQTKYADPDQAVLQLQKYIKQHPEALPAEPSQPVTLVPQKTDSVQPAGQQPEAPKSPAKKPKAKGKKNDGKIASTQPAVTHN